MDSFVEELTARLVAPECKHGISRFGYLVLFDAVMADLDQDGDSDNWGYDDQAEELQISNTFCGDARPLLDCVRETTDEPIQRDAYLPMLRLFKDDLASIMANERRIFGAIKRGSDKRDG